MDLKSQIELEVLFNKNQTLMRLDREFRIPVIERICDSHEIPFSFAISLLSQMVLHKRANLETLVGLLRGHFKAEENPLQACADMLLKAAQADLVDWHGMAQQFVVRIDVSADVYEDLERYQYPLPLVVRPREVKTNRDTGYYTSSGSIILKANHHEDDVCLDHINRVNAIRLKLNTETARLVQNQWRNLDRCKPGEDPKEYQARIKAFEKFDTVSRDVIDSLFAMTDREFYLTHKYDKRGRCYAQGYHINPQGNAWSKAIVEFAEQEIVS